MVHSVGDEVANAADPETIRREDAIERFDSHWKFSYGSEAAYEALGVADTETTSEYASRSDLVADARSARRSRAEREVARLEGILTHPRSRIVIWRARLGLCSNAAHVLEKIADLRSSLAEQHAILADVGSWEPRYEQLPDTLVLPPISEPGRVVWGVDYTWPLSSGIRISEHRVTSFSLQSRLESLLRVRARDIWDYEILYQCVGDSGDWSFKYARADESDPEIKTTFHGRRAFLTREAAEQCVREVVDMMRAKADEAIARSEEHTSELQSLMRI